MVGTVVCGVTDTREGRDAAQLAKALSDRLGLRLVLAHAIDLPRGAQDSLTGRQQRRGAEHALAEIARDLGDGDEVALRIELGEPAELLAWIAAEERAAMIVLGSRAHGLLRRRLRSRLARSLRAVTPVPVLVAPPQTRKRSAQRLAVPEASAAS